jgi:hypothetical protein
MGELTIPTASSRGVTIASLNSNRAVRDHRIMFFMMAGCAFALTIYESAFRLLPLIAGSAVPGFRDTLGFDASVVIITGVLGTLATLYALLGIAQKPEAVQAVKDGLLLYYPKGRVRRIPWNDKRIQFVFYDHVIPEGWYLGGTHVVRWGRAAARAILFPPEVFEEICRVATAAGVKIERAPYRLGSTVSATRIQFLPVP